ncbi:hypothetical protein [Polluticaenibacter yanchengensis]|uniref:Uncharacterized protein n=1 Tax=Polluticaenibacter yanchengensis TaxID=3014562 RepID=A0ABT4UEN4_9BACT|nr:hypothetical protein [Chitinophagaceae bacterium LY-5]
MSLSVILIYPLQTAKLLINFIILLLMPIINLTCEPNINAVMLENEELKLLQKSYQLIEDQCVIIKDDNLISHITNSILQLVSKAQYSVYTIQMLLQTNKDHPTSYIAFAILDAGYPVKSNLTQSHIRVYHLLINGFAHLSTDFGKTIIRPATKLDKMVSRFWNSSIKFEGADLFNKRYYLESTEKEKVKSLFNIEFLKSISKMNNISICIEHNKMVISFLTPLKPGHSVMLANILNNCHFISNGENAR